MKTCRVCRLAKPYAEFSTDPYCKDGYAGYCKVCGRAKYAARVKKKHTPIDQRPPVTPDLTVGPALKAFEAEAALEALAEKYKELPDPPDKNIRIEVVEEVITRVEEHRLKQRVRDLEREAEELVKQLSEGGEYAAVVAEVLAKQGEEPPAVINPRERASGLREGTPLILASDWHIEEEVRPEQVAGRNRYDLEISARRMERFFEASMWAWRTQRQIFKIRDVIAWWGGDFITNFLHEENPQSNLLSPTEATHYAFESMVKGFDFWLEDPEIEQYVVPMNDGNHGRLTKKMHSATRTQNSLEVFLYAQLAYHYRNEPRMRFILPTSQFTFLDDVYGRTIRFLHGDVFKYGGGIGGITVPMFRALGRWEKTKHADLTCMGHWHQRYCLPDVMVNGSLIGYNAYAMGGGFAFESPVQSLRMLDAQRWCGTDIPLWVSERSDDIMTRGE